MDEINEKISNIQEACLFIYNGYYCVNKIFNSILYCCESINKKLYLNKTELIKNSSTTSEEEFISLQKQVKIDYEVNILKNFDLVRKMVNEIKSVRFRVEILENVYSLVYLMSNHLKDDDNDGDGDSNEDDKVPLLNSQVENNISNVLDKLNENYKNEQISVEKSIYADTDNLKFETEKKFNTYDNSHISFNSESSKQNESSLLNTECSNREYNHIIKKNAAGGGSFLCNEFLTRDLLHLLKDLIGDLNSFIKQTNEQKQEKYSYCSSMSFDEMNLRFLQLQQVVNETMWRFQLVKSSKISNEYGKFSLNILEVDTSLSNEDLLTYVIIKTMNVEKVERRNSIIDEQDSRTRRPRGQSIKSNKSTSSLTKLSGNMLKYSKQRTNFITQKLLSNKETLCTILLKEKKLNEANQLIKIYENENEFKNSFEFKQVQYFDTFESTIHSLKELNKNLRLNSTSYVDKSMLSIQLNKIIDNLAAKSNDNQTVYSINICDLITVSNINIGVCEYLNEYASSSLNRLEISNGELFSLLNQKLANFIQRMQIIVNSQNEVNNNITEFITSFNGINFTSSSTDDVLAFFSLTENLNIKLDTLKENFEREEEKRKEKDSIISSMIDKATNEKTDFIKKSIHQHDLFLEISTLLKKILQNRQSILNIYFFNEFQHQSHQIDEETTIGDSNYLLSFYEYCKILYEYFLDKNSLATIVTNSYFSILGSPPAVLICKLIFQDLIKPQLIESLTKKLNLNLTAILLHNSCPSLKLTQAAAIIRSNENKALLRRESRVSNKDERIDLNQSLDLLNTSNNNLELENLDNNFYLNTEYLFYTILNKSEIQYCSLKKPDLLIKDLLFKVLKFIKKHSNEKQSDKLRHNTVSSVNSLTSTVSLELAANIYDSAEFKTITNETQELQYINLMMLKTNNQKISFFINLYNMLTIHSYFYFASIKHKASSLGSSNNSSNKAPIVANSKEQEALFNNLTEKLLFIQRMSYKVGQIGCVSLFELKYIILNSNKLSEPVLINKNSENKKSRSSFNSDLINIEPLWSPYIPNLTENFYSNKVIFSLVSCLESDAQICVYNSDSLLNDQLNVQMSLFLNNSIYVDLSDGILYLPKLVIDHANLFESTNRIKKLNNYKFENLINFLLESLNKTLSDNLKSLIDLYGDNYGENIDEFGYNELPFKIVEIEESQRFLLNLELNENQFNSWYKKKMKNKPPTHVLNQLIDIPLLATQPSIDPSLSLEDTFKQLNSDCLSYIEQNSPLISNSLGFLFDLKKQVKFFEEISQNEQQNLLNRFIQLYVPLDYLKEFSLSKKLNLITQFLLINKTDEFKIELIINLANYYIEKSDWNSILDLLNNCTQDNEEFNEVFEQQNSNSKSQEQKQQEQQPPKSTSTKLRPIISASYFELNNSKFTIRDLYNLYDYACICCAYKESILNEKSYLYLFKMKNFSKQIRYCLSLMYLWPIDSCLEVVDFCLTRLKSLDDKFLSTNITFSKYKDYIDYLNDIKIEFESYKELTQCAKQTLDFLMDSQHENENEIKLKKICQLCLAWQTAKQILEAPSTSQNDETIDLILSIFVLNNKFQNAKLLCKKLGLNIKFKFKLDYSHIKHRLLNLNLSNIINIIDLNSILLSECITFADEKFQVSELNRVHINPMNNEISYQNVSYSNYDYYLFSICFQLINELKNLKNVKNTIMIALTEYIFQNYCQFLNEEQLNELRLLELTAKILNLFLVENTNSTQTNDIINIEHYIKHYSNPIYIIEQLLMNSKIDICSKAINLCRALLPQIKQIHINDEINKILVTYADKALKFRFVNNNNVSVAATVNDSVKQKPKSSKITINPPSPSNRLDDIKPKSPLFKDIFKRSSLSSKPEINANSFKQRTSLQSFGTSPSSFNQKNNKLTLASMSMFENDEDSFTMPLVPPTKEQWIKDELVNECMVCNTERFTLLNRRHHCRRCGRIVCSNCSKNLTLINEIPQRTCDDCYKQIQRNNFFEKRQSFNDNDSFRESKQKPDLHFTFGIKKLSNDKKGQLNSQKNLSSSVSSLTSINSNITISHFVDLNEQVTWQLFGEKEKDEEIRDKFRYQQAPSTSLCLSILDLHDQPLECGKELLRMCDDISCYLQNTDYQVEDTSLIINMIKYLLCNAKVKLLQNSSTNIISLCDTYLSLIDILEQLLLANCSFLPSLHDLRNTESSRRIRNRLLEEERYELAMNLSTKCGLDSQTVWASWGLTELRRGNHKDARSKFDKCLKVSSDKNQATYQSQIKTLNDIISYLENAPPIRLTGVKFDFS